jgi:hypothetical protein
MAENLAARALQAKEELVATAWVADGGTMAADHRAKAVDTVCKGILGQARYL